MISLTPISWTAAAGRLVLAIALGSAIGWEREIDHKAAGLRTNMLVALGAALFILVPIQSGLAALDPSTTGRNIQGIVTGVGFVGAGSILRDKKVHGLTSAAAVWVSAALGIAAGMGLWPLGLMGATLAIAILRLMKWIESRFLKRSRPHP